MTLILLIETFVVKLIVESTYKPALWMESIAVTTRSNKICAFIFSINRLQKQDSIELIEEEDDKKSNHYFIRLTFTKIMDRFLFLILIFIYINMILNTFPNDVEQEFDLLYVDV